MKTSSRWLLVFGAAIAVLVIVAVVLVLTMSGREDAPLLSEDTPKGIVQRYLLALEAEDFIKAYDYFSSSTKQDLTYEKWQPRNVISRDRPGFKITLVKSSVKGNEATVYADVDIFRPDGPFDNPVSTSRITFYLVKEGTNWRINSPTYIYWFFY